MLRVFPSIKCLKISCFGKIYKKEASELETCRAGFGISKGALYLLTKESKAELLGALPPMHPRSLQGVEIKATRRCRAGGEEMSLEDLLLPYPDLHSAPHPAQRARLWEEAVKCSKHRLNYWRLCKQ